VAANGGRSALLALLVEPAGTLVPDGTVVFFFTNLGTVDAQAKTRDGVARATFVADSRSGTASVTAFSGGNTATTTTSTTATADLAGSTISQTVSITVGSALPANLTLTANPPRITNPRNSDITANVFDESGNPVANVPVIFSVATAGLLQERLDSGGQPVFTDTNGQARDVLRTSQNQADPVKVVTVTGTLPTAKANSVPVQIN